MTFFLFERATSLNETSLLVISIFPCSIPPASCRQVLGWRIKEGTSLTCYWGEKGRGLTLPVCHFDAKTWWWTVGTASNCMSQALSRSGSYCSSWVNAGSTQGKFVVEATPNTVDNYFYIHLPASWESSVNLTVMFLRQRLQTDCTEHTDKQAWKVQTKWPYVISWWKHYLECSVWCF